MLLAATPSTAPGSCSDTHMRRKVSPTPATHALPPPENCFGGFFLRIVSGAFFFLFPPPDTDRMPRHIFPSGSDNPSAQRSAARAEAAATSKNKRKANAALSAVVSKARAICAASSAAPHKSGPKGPHAHLEGSRKQVKALVEAGLSCRETAELSGVFKKSEVSEIVLGHREAKTNPRGPSRLIPEGSPQEEVLRRLALEEPGGLINVLPKFRAETGVDVGLSTAYATIGESYGRTPEPIGT